MKVTNKDYDIVIYGIDHYSTDEFISINSDASAVGWCDGFLFTITHIDAVTFSELLTEKNQRTFAGVDFSRMEKYKSVLITKQNGKIAVLDHTHTEIFQKLAKYIREEFLPNSEKN